MGKKILVDVMFDHNAITNTCSTVYIYETEDDALRVYKKLWDICHGEGVEFGPGKIFGIEGRYVIRKHLIDKYPKILDSFAVLNTLGVFKER